MALIQESKDGTFAPSLTYVWTGTVWLPASAANPLAVNPNQLYLEDTTKPNANGAATGGGSGVVRGGTFTDAPTLPTLVGNQAIQTGTISKYGPKSVFWVLVTTPVAYFASGQATIQFFGAKQAIAAVGTNNAGGGSVSRILPANNMRSLGAAVNLGASAATLPNGHYGFGGETIAGLNSVDLFIGAEIIFPGVGNITAGVFTVEIEHGAAA